LGPGRFFFSSVGPSPSVLAGDDGNSDAGTPHGAVAASGVAGRDALVHAAMFKASGCGLLQNIGEVGAEYDSPSICGPGRFMKAGA